MKKNLLIKLIVLLIAIILWIQQILLKTHKQEINVPIQLKNIPEQLTIGDSELPIVGLNYQALGFDILKLKFSDIYFEVDASDFTYGNNNFMVTKRKLHLPKNINLISKNITTNTNLSVSLDKIIETRKYIIVQFETTKDKEFFIKNRIKNLHQRIKLKGPYKKLKDIENISTEKISSKDVEEGKLVVKLLSPDPQIILAKNEVTLEVTQSKTIERVFSLVPIKFPETEDLSIIPQKVSIRIKGPQEVVQDLDKNSIQANLNISKIKNNSTTVKFDLPSGIEVLEYTPYKIQVIKNN